MSRVDKVILLHLALYLLSAAITLSDGYAFQAIWVIHVAVIAYVFFVFGRRNKYSFYVQLTYLLVIPTLLLVGVLRHETDGPNEIESIYLILFFTQLFLLYLAAVFVYLDRGKLGEVGGDN